jgi:hypothetical protein
MIYFYVDFQYGKDSFLKIIIHNHRNSLVNLWLSSYLIKKKIKYYLRRNFFGSQKNKYITINFIEFRIVNHSIYLP